MPVEFHIHSPIWHTGSVGLADHKIIDDVEVYILYTDRRSNLSFPGTHRMSYSKAKSYPTRATKNGLLLRIIPIADFEVGP